jgi:hypothetical protein
LATFAASASSRATCRFRQFSRLLGTLRRLRELCRALGDFLLEAGVERRALTPVAFDPRDQPVERIADDGQFGIGDHPFSRSIQSDRRRVLGRGRVHRADQRGQRAAHDTTTDNQEDGPQRCFLEYRDANDQDRLAVDLVDQIPPCRDEFGVSDNAAAGFVAVDDVEAVAAGSRGVCHFRPCACVRPVMVDGNGAVPVGGTDKEVAVDRIADPQPGDLRDRDNAAGDRVELVGVHRP